MQVKQLLHGTIAFAAVMLFTGIAAAQAVGDYRTRGTGDWDALLTWERFNGSIWVGQSPSGSVPNASNFVTIRSGHIVTVDTSEAADHLDVQGDIVIAAGGCLVLDGSGSPTHNIASGSAITLSSSTSCLAFVDFDQTVTGLGKIIGQNPSAEIQIEEYNGNGGTLTLTSEVVIEGAMMIKPIPLSGTGTATLDNQNKVVANGNGDLALHADLLLVDDVTSATVRWEASGSSNAVLLFNRNVTTLQGDFLLNNCAKMEFNASVTTSGELWSSPRAGTIQTYSNTFATASESFTGNYVIGGC